MKKILSVLIVGVAAIILAMTVVLPASAGRAETEKLTDFYTSALQGDEGFQWVYCSQATRVTLGDRVIESYQCELSGFVDGQGLPDIFGVVVLPDRAMRFSDDTGFFYFSDFLFLDCGEVVFADTWTEQLTPSGQVHFRAVYSDMTTCS